MSNRVSQYVLLVEDLAQQRLLYRYLDKCGVKKRDIRPIALPASRGSGEQYVREQFPLQVQLFRKRLAKAKTVLILMTDADAMQPTERQAQLERVLRESGERDRASDEPIAILIPKRHVETWIACLAGQAVSESEDCKRLVGRDSISLAAIKLRERVTGISTGHTVPSMDRGINELQARLPTVG